METDRIEEACQEEIYQKAIAAMRGIRNPELQQKAIDLFKTIPGWRDAEEKIAVCEARIRELRAKEEAERLEAEAKAKKRKKATAIVLSVLALCAAVGILLPTVILPAIRYGQAKALFKAGRYEEAITAFEAMKGYGDSETKILDCRYEAAAELFAAEDYEAAMAAFAELDGYRDSAEKVEACRTASVEQNYAEALELCAAGRYDLAYPMLTALGDYRDSAKKAEEIYEAYKTAKLRNAEVGDCVLFGAYEQDNDASNGKEDIEWLVLSKEDDRVLLISRYALDYQRYNETKAAVSWETCTLRKWLNDSFLNAAFSAEEQERIQDTALFASEDAEEGASSGSGAADKVFLLNLRNQL